MMWALAQTAIAPPIPLQALAPELVLLLAACVALLFGLAGPAWRRSIPWITLGGIVVAIITAYLLPPGDGADAMRGNGLAYGQLAIFVRITALILGFLLTLAASPLGRSSERGEFFSMLLFSLLGLLLVGAADNLVMLFLALELVSIPAYILVTLSRSNIRALEAGTKYFYLGAMAAAITAYGFSFLYGVAGGPSLTDATGRISNALQSPGTLTFALATAGVVLSLGGLLFKISAVPLHFYVADVYQGAASPVAGFLGFVPKIAGFVAIIKIIALTDHWAEFSAQIFATLWIVAAASMTIGNVLALMQTNVKRLLAYSGIAHSGYMLVGLLAGPGQEGQGLFGDGTAAVLYYAVIYGIANLGAFAILGVLRVRGEPCESVADLAGLLRRSPSLALMMSLAMLTLMGLPPTPGFWGKLNLFGSALAFEQTAPAYDTSIFVLVILAVLNTAVAAAYYLRVVAAMLLYENERPAEPLERGAQRMSIELCALLMLIFAFYPSVLLKASRGASRDPAVRGPIAAARAAPDAASATRKE